MMKRGKFVLISLFMMVSNWPAAAEVLIVGNKGEDTISFISIQTGRECARLPTGKAPHEIAISPDGTRAAVVAYGGTSIDLFDVHRQKYLHTIDLSPNAGPHGIVWLKPNRIVVTFDRSNSVAILDPRNGAFESLHTGQRGSHMVAASPDRRRAYVANILSGTVSVIDLVRKVKEGDIATGGNPEGLAITPDGSQLWVGDNSGPRVRVIDLAKRSVIATLPTDPVAIRLAITPDGKTAIASNFLSGTLTLFDVRSIAPVRTIKLAGSAKAMQVTLAISADSRIAFVAETGLSQIAQVDLRSGAVERRIIAGKGSDGLAIVKGHCSTIEKRK